MGSTNSICKDDVLNDLSGLLAGHSGVFATGVDEAARRVYVYVARQHQQYLRSILPETIHEWRIVVKSSGSISPAG